MANENVVFLNVHVRNAPPMNLFHSLQDLVKNGESEGFIEAFGELEQLLQRSVLRILKEHEGVLRMDEVSGVFVVNESVLEAERLDDAVKAIQFLSHDFVFPLEHEQVFLAFVLFASLDHQGLPRDRVLGIVNVALASLSKF